MINKAYILKSESLSDWLDDLLKSYAVIGPVKKRKGQVVFEQIQKAEQIDLNYCTTMLGPRKFIYNPKSELFSINRKSGMNSTPEQKAEKRLIFAVHPCDMHAISVLDRTLLGHYKDSYYQQLRQNTVTIVLNCNKACDAGFCASMGTGPHLQLKDGFDIVLTQLKNNFLVEFGSEKGKKIFAKQVRLQKAGIKESSEKKKIERSAKKTFTKSIDTKGLPELLMRHLNHPVYKETADSRCLNCTNCTMVCPTCYCYNLEDYTDFDLKKTTRSRYWDSCHELNFAKVHEGNFRLQRKERLRQFVTHKLSTWVEQFGCFGCIGCGRCMTWCPTGIDLTEMAKEIQRDEKAGLLK
jgi:sulfhydrogenase subunit beta (sulfur reductase)